MPTFDHSRWTGERENSEYDKIKLGLVTLINYRPVGLHASSLVPFGGSHLHLDTFNLNQPMRDEHIQSPRWKRFTWEMHKKEKAEKMSETQWNWLACNAWKSARF